MIKFTHQGSFDNIERFLKKAKSKDYRAVIERYAQEGVSALRSSTPKDSGLTASSWAYEIIYTNSGFRIAWTNSHLVEGIPVAILLQYGHGTRGGTFVQGIDYINPVMRPIFDKIAENLWKEVTR